MGFALRWCVLADTHLSPSDKHLYKNLQGDILSIYDTNGTLVASYKYNAWGECSITNYTSAAIGNINPFRYRGYYYDTETDLYYLNARYYDPYTKRFVNADTYINANGDFDGFNMYAYCSNNPIMFVDITGEGIIPVVLITGVLAFLIGTQTKVGGDLKPSKDSDEYVNTVNELMDKTSDIKIDKEKQEFTFSIDLSNTQLDNSLYNEYTDTLADFIESEKALELNGNKIDRKQLFCEIKLHGENLNNLISSIRARANPANIKILFTGEVVDPRPYINWLARFLYEDDYK